MRICYGESWADLALSPDTMLMLAAVPVGGKQPNTHDPILSALCMALAHDCQGVSAPKNVTQASELIHARGDWLSSIDILINASTEQPDIASRLEAVKMSLANMLGLPLERIRVTIGQPPVAVLPASMLQVKTHLLVGKSN